MKKSTWNSRAWRKMARIPTRQELWPQVSQLRAEGYTPDEAVALAEQRLEAQAKLAEETHANVVCDGENYVCSDTEPHTHYEPIIPEAISQVVEDEPAKRGGRTSQFARHPVTNKFVTKQEEEALRTLHELSLD